MSLLTVERNSPSPQESDAEETLSSSSHEGFVAREHYVTSLPPRPWASLGRHGGEQLRIFTHLKKVMKLLRNSDTIKLAVELENMWPRKVTKHLVLVVTNGYQDTEEAIVLGTEQEDSIVRLGLVLPLWRDTEIKLDGDGGFIVHSGDRQAVFKPSSVQSMWTTLQSLYQSTENARLNNYYVGGLSHTWMSYYQAQLTEDYLVRNEWNLMKDVESFRPDSPIYSSSITSSKTDNMFEKQLVSRLRGIMLHEDLEEVTSRQLREKLEKEMDMQLNEYREFLDRHMLRILGQLEQPSKILDYLYLGSEWNASNLSELKELGIGYILNVTREIDNFYPEVFKYLNVRLYDVPDSELIKHWGKTYRFIKEAKMMDTKVLVHCKMGISRSAATVIAYMMKEYQMPLVEARKHVKSIRGCINPNDGFLSQLRSYEGILTARHNPRWGRHAPTRLCSKRSFSDPDIMQSLEKEELERRGVQQRAAQEGDDGSGEWEREGGDTHFRPIHNVASAFNIPNLVHQGMEEPELTFLAEEQVAGSQQDPNSPQLGAEPLAEGGACVHSTPVDKTRNLQHFLASLPVVVGSSMDDGIGENIPTSNSGSAYSSPMYTPPDEESIHMHMAAQCRERELDGEKQALLGEDSPDSALAMRPADSEVSSREVSSLQPSRTPSPPQMISTTPQPTTTTTRDQGEEEVLAVGRTINSPVSHNHRSYSLPQALSGYIARADSGTPTRKLAGSGPSPTSSSQALSGLLRKSPIPTVPETEPLRVSPPNTQGDDREVRSEEEQSATEKGMELRGDSAAENMTPRSREKFMHHRRTKSDSHHDTSGPIKTAQISSVPERVKEIEEKVTSTQSLQSINQATDSHPLSVISSNSRSSSEEHLSPPFADSAGDRGKCPQHEASCRAATESPSRHTSLSPKPSLSSCTVSSSSSPPAHPPVQTSSSSPPAHPPVQTSSSSPPAHPPVQTSFSLPTSTASSTDPDSTSSPPPQPSSSPDTVVSSLHGVVKAKVQNIEGKKAMVQQVAGGAQAELHAAGADPVIKRTSVVSGQRPQSEIIFHSPYMGMVEVNDPSDTESQTSTAPSSSRELDTCGVSSSSSAFQPHHRSAFSSVHSKEGGSKGAGMRRRNTTCDMLSAATSKQVGDSRSDHVQSCAVFNAWVGIIPTEDLRADDLASVLELRQKFEKDSPKDPSRRIQQLSSLRRSCSLRDTRLTSPPVQLGGSARWKKYSSNLNLQGSSRERRWRACASASPTASGSQQSLTSSGKI